MTYLNELLLFLHFLGLALGFSVSFGTIVMAAVIARSTPQDQAVLARFPPALSRLSRWALLLLWTTGLTMVFTRWHGFAGMPWQFHVKLTAVVLLTLTVEYVAALQKAAQRGDPSAPARIVLFGKVATVLALVAMLFAVLAFG